MGEGILPVRRSMSRHSGAAVERSFTTHIPNAAPTSMCAAMALAPEESPSKEAAYAKNLEPALPPKDQS